MSVHSNNKNSVHNNIVDLFSWPVNCVLVGVLSYFKIKLCVYAIVHIDKKIK